MRDGEAERRAMQVAAAVCHPDFSSAANTPRQTAPHTRLLGGSGHQSLQVVHLQRIMDQGLMKYPGDIPPNTHVVSLPDKAGTCPLSPGRLAFSRAAVSRFHWSCFYLVNASRPASPILPFLERNAHLAVQHTLQVRIRRDGLNVLRVGHPGSYVVGKNHPSRTNQRQQLV